MPDQTPREQLAALIVTHAFYVDDQKRAWCLGCLDATGKDLLRFPTVREYADHLVPLIEGEGWRPPARVIDDPTELDELPPGSVVMMTTWMRRAFVHAGGGRWWVAGPIRSEISAREVLDGCAVEVLHTPENGDR